VEDGQAVDIGAAFAPTALTEPSELPTEAHKQATQVVVEIIRRTRFGRPL
jgi:hypothetical protein